LKEDRYPRSPMHTAVLATELKSDGFGTDEHITRSSDNRTFDCGRFCVHAAMSSMIPLALTSSSRMKTSVKRLGSHRSIASQAALTSFMIYLLSDQDQDTLKSNIT